MALGKLPVPGRPTVWMIIGQGPPALAVGAGGGCLDIFTLISYLWETTRYRLKYCLKGSLSQKQPTNRPSPWETARYRLKYCLKGSLSQKQPTNRPSPWETARYRLKYCLKGPLNPQQATKNLCFILISVLSVL